MTCPYQVGAKRGVPRSIDGTRVHPVLPRGPTTRSSSRLRVVRLLLQGPACGDEVVEVEGARVCVWVRWLLRWACCWALASAWSSSGGHPACEAGRAPRLSHHVDDGRGLIVRVRAGAASVLDMTENKGSQDVPVTPDDQEHEVNHARDGQRWDGTKWVPAGAEGIASVESTPDHEDEVAPPA